MSGPGMSAGVSGGAEGFGQEINKAANLGDQILARGIDRVDRCPVRLPVTQNLREGAGCEVIGDVDAGNET